MKRLDRALASAGATVANLGPGYDVLGLCLSGPRDIVTAERTDDGLVTIAAISGDGGRLPLEASRNCAGVAAQVIRDLTGDARAGVRLTLEKGLPLGSGLGSSAASSVAAAMATAALLMPELPKSALLEACREGERLATGTPHPDNVAPALFGGIVACIPRPNIGPEAVETVSLTVPEGLAIACVKPDISVRTADARRVLPAAVPMADMVYNLAQMAGLVAALGSGDLGLLGRSLGDRVATPYRSGLIPGFDAAMDSAKAAGALGSGISGSGPTVFALCAGLDVAVAVKAAMVAAFESVGVSAFGLTGLVDPGGARVELR